MSETPVPTNLPTLSEKIWGWFGVQVPSIPLPQTVKNLDKALGRLIAVGGENLASRMEHDTSRRQARAKAEADIIDVSGGYLGSHITDQGPFTERALEFAFGFRR